MRIFQHKVRLTPSRRGLALAAALVAAVLTTGCGDRTAKANGWAAQAQALLDAGDVPGAREAMRRALSYRDDQLDLILLDGRIKYRANDLGPAFAAYSLALAIDPQNPEALTGVSQLGMATGAERESAEATDKILELDPNNAQALMIKGLERLDKKDYPATLAISERLLKADPQNEAGRALRARALNLSGRQKEALALLESAVQQSGPTRMLVTAMLETARDQRDPELMIRQYRALAQLVPKNIDLTIDEANVQYKRGKVAEARARGWALITENGTDARAMQRLTDLWAEYGDVAPLTDGQLQQLAAQGAPIARLELARFYLARRDFATAKALVGDQLGYDPMGLRVRIGFMAGDAGADAAADQVLKEDKSNCDALAVRAMAAVRRGRPDEGVTAAQQITAECPDGDGYDLLARAQLARNNAIGARNAFLEGARSRPLATAPVARYVDWLVRNGDLNGAVNNARSLTQRAPAKVSSWRLLAAVCARAKDPVCLADARKGEADARTNFAIDLPPGERRPSPLLGNSWR